MGNGMIREIDLHDSLNARLDGNETDIGDLASLDTTDKSSLVDAINENVSNIASNYASLSENTQQISGLKNGSGAEIALLNGWAKGRSASVFKSGKTAFLNVDCNGGLISSGTLIFTLPNGFRPVRTLTLPCMATSSLSINTSAILVLDTGGNGTLYDIQNNSNGRLTINCIFECGV